MASDRGTQLERVVDGPARFAVSRWIVWVSWGSLVAFSVLTIGLPLIGVGTFLGTELLQRFAPWSAAGESTSIGTNAMVGDTIDAVVPQMWAIVEAARHGVFAEWTPFQAGGSELGGLPNSGLYSPISIAWWFVPLSYAPGITKLIEIGVVTLGMSLFLRRLGLPNPTWALASLVFVSSGFMISWTNWPQTRVAAFIPLLFWALDRAAVRRRLLDVLPVGVALAGMLLGGFPAIVGYALYAGAVYVLVRAIVVHRRFWRVIGAGAVSALGVVLGFLLSAWTMLPFALNAIAILDFSGRRQGPDNHMAINDLLSALVPSLVGEVSTGDTWGVNSPVERLSYVGAMVVVLVAVACLIRPFVRGRRSMITFFAVGVVLSVVLTYIGGPILGAAQQLPIFDNNRIGRLRVMIGFFVAVMAAVGFARLIEPDPRRRLITVLGPERPVRRWLWGLLTLSSGAAAIGFLVLAIRRGVLLAPARFTELLSWQALTTVAIGLCGVVIVLVVLLARRAVPRIVAVCVVPILVVVPAVFVADLWWPKSDLSTVYPDTPTTAFLQEHLGESRYASVDQTMFPGTNSVYRVRSLGGHTFQTVQWKSLLLRLDPEAYASATYSALSYPGMVASANSPIMDRLAVKYLVMEPNLPVPGLVEPAEASSAAIPVGGGDVAVSTVHTGPVRSLSFNILDRLLDTADGATLTVSLVDPVTGEVLTTTSTWYATILGQRNVALDAGSLGVDTAWRAEISVDAGHGGILADLADPTAAAVSVTRPLDDGLSVAHTGDATVIERSSALERVRWASNGVVERDPSRRVDLMEDPLLPPTTVLLERSEDVPAGDVPSAGAAGSGIPPSTAVVDVEDQAWDVNRTVVDVDADGAGWVVFADSLRRPGWSVTVDGDPAELVDAEQAGAAVRVEAGSHRIELTYRTPGLAPGIVTSAASAGVVLLAYLAVFLMRRRRPRA
ncbi:YfhO family protein [Plantibacter flavus]|uniref:YfhO family protein n=1 Tax=Plantibacter flavus TaxID=150123 RepID=UPI003F152439